MSKPGHSFVHSINIGWKFTSLVSENQKWISQTQSSLPLRGWTRSTYVRFLRCPRCRADRSNGTENLGDSCDVPAKGDMWGVGVEWIHLGKGGKVPVQVNGDAGTNKIHPLTKWWEIRLEKIQWRRPGGGRGCPCPRVGYLHFGCWMWCASRAIFVSHLHW